jgi:hypothetical protein
MLLQDRSVTPTRSLQSGLFVALLGGRDLLLFAKYLFGTPTRLWTMGYRRC